MEPLQVQTKFSDHVHHDPGHRSPQVGFEDTVQCPAQPVVVDQAELPGAEFQVSGIE